MNFLFFVIPLTLFLLVLAAAIWVSAHRDDWTRQDGTRASTKPLWLVAFLFLILTVAGTGFGIIPAGHVGIVTWFGAVENRTLQPGAYFVVPLVESVVDVETRVHAVHFENIGAASKEYQDVFLTGTLNIHVDPQGANDLYQTVGLDYEARIVVPFLNDLVKEIVPTYRIGDILAHRAEIRHRTVEALNTKLNPYHIVVDDLAIANITFSEAYTHAIEEKQVQEQRVLTEQQILEQRRIQADQLVAQARGEAQATIERAQGQAEANRLLTASLTDQLIRWQAIQRLNDKIQVVLLPSGDNFLLDVSRFVPEVQP